MKQQITVLQKLNNVNVNEMKKNENEKFLIKNAQNRTINNSENLQNLIKKIIWKKFKLVN